jgi:UDP-glucose 4-epimerase
MTRVLVTGAGGYLGGRLVAALQAPDRIIRTLVRHIPDDRPTDAGRVVADLVLAPAAVLSDACAGIDAVVHLAGPNEVLCAADPDRALCETTVGTRRIADAAAAAGVRRFVYVSTVHVYGAAMAEGATVTEDTVPAPRAIYGTSRLASEHLVASAAAVAGTGGMGVVILRVTNLIGAPADPAVARWTLLTNDLCRQAVVGGALELRSHGMHWRDFVTMADSCRIVEAATATDGPVPPGTYNVGSGRPMTGRRVAALVQDVVEELTGRRPPLRAPAPPEDPPEPYRVSVERLAGLGLRADSTARSAIEETFRFCLEHRDRLVSHDGAGSAR